MNKEDMNTYNKDKLSIRPQLPNTIINDDMTADELFQNDTLRPILKMQHDLIAFMLKEYIKVKKNAYYKLSIENRSHYVKNNILADRMIIHELRGLVIGLFTSEELVYYLAHKSAMNKRIQSLLFQRINDIAQYFKTPE